MGLFDFIIKESVKCLKDAFNPFYTIKHMSNLRHQVRNPLKKMADNISSTFGDYVRLCNNVEDTLEYAFDSQNFGIFRALFSKEVINLYPGDHLFVQQFGYTHHGLYI